MAREKPPNPEQTLEGIVSRLYSQDANDRVKAAAELGEIGTEEQAPELLKVAYEDEKSTVRQMAIQSYAEILEEDAIDDIIEAAKDHFDEHVRLYAINSLGRWDSSLVSDYLREFIDLENKRHRVAVTRSMIHANADELADDVFERLKVEGNPLVLRNLLEALSMWKYEPAKDYIESELKSNFEDLNTEIKTFVSFYLAIFGDDESQEYLEEGEVDSFIRIKYEGDYYRGRKGLLKLVDKL